MVICSNACEKLWSNHKEVCNYLVTEVTEWPLRQTSAVAAADFFANCNIPAFPILVENAELLTGGGLAFDLGCGNGSTTIYLLKQKLRVVSVDRNELAISILKKRTGTFGNNCEAIIADLVTFEFGVNPDLIIANDVLSYLPPEKLIVMMSNIILALKHGGLFAGTLFIRGGKSEPLWMSWGAWLLPNEETVRNILSMFRVKVINCRRRPKNDISAVIEFLVQKI